MNAPAPRLLTREEFADLARMSVRSLDKLIAAGTVRVVRLGRLVRIPADEIDRLIGLARAG